MNIDIPGQSNEWEIEVIKRRFLAEYHIIITPEQAQEIFKQERELGSTKHFFSIWEDMDYELSVMSPILNGDQIEAFGNVKEKSIKKHEEWLVEQDKEILNQLSLARETLGYYNEKLLPAIQNDYTLLIGGFDADRPKINYLKAEYKRFLDDSKKEIYLTHFRNSRRLQPNVLQFSLLTHKLSCLFPDYNSFKRLMDEPTRQVKEHLKEKLKYYSYINDEKVRTIFQQLHAFNSRKTHDQTGEVPGWHMEFSPPEEEERENRLMCMVLFDRSKYDSECRFIL